MKIKLTKTNDTSLYDFSYEMKKNIIHWWKTNMDCKIDKKIANVFKKLIVHEIIHYKIVKKSAANIKITLTLEKAEKEGFIGFYYEGVCNYIYPHKFNFPKYYPVFVFIEFKHFLFDVISDTFRFAIFTTLIHRLSKFLKCLISFKVRS